MACLDGHTVAELQLPKPLITLSQTGDTLFSAIDSLASHHLLSAPVVADDGSLVGIVDSLDIVAYITAKLKSGADTLEDCGLDKVKDFKSSEPPCVSMEDSLNLIVNLFSGSARRCIVLKDGKVYSVITQSLMLEFFQTQKELLDSSTLESSASTKSSGSFFCVKDDQKASEAFKSIHEEGLSSCGVLDEDGAIIMVLSAADLVVGLAGLKDKGESLAHLQETEVVEFLAETRVSNPKARASAILVAPDSSFEQVLNKLSKCRVHRVVVAKDKRPSGVISLTDVCKHIAGK